MQLNHILNRSLSVLALLPILFAGGCGTTPPSRFYVLRPIAETTLVGSEDAAGAVTIGIGPVDLPAHLERPQIAVKGKGNEIVYAEFDRWAGKLDANMLDVIEKNLAELLAPDWITKFPGVDVSHIDYWVVLHVLTFEGEMGGDIDLYVRWLIHEKTTSTILSAGLGSYTEATGEDGYPAVVAAQSRLLGHLSRDLASDLSRIVSGAKAKPAATGQE